MYNINVNNKIMPKEIFKKNAKVDAKSILMGGALPYKAKKDMFSVPTNYGTAAKPSALPRTEFTQSQQHSAPVSHGDDKVYSGTLYSYYTDQGLNLPSVEERGETYQKAGLGSSKSYKGTVTQNKALYDKLTTETKKTKYDKDDEIVSVATSSMGPDESGEIVAKSTKQVLGRNSGVTNVDDITDDDVKRTKERGAVRAKRIARRHARRAGRRGTEVVEPGGVDPEMNIAEKKHSETTGTGEGPVGGGGEESLMFKKKKYYGKKKK